MLKYFNAIGVIIKKILLLLHFFLLKTYIKPLTILTTMLLILMFTFFA